MTKVHVVKQGETMSRLAWAYGFASPTKILDHPDNALLKEQYGDGHVLKPGEELSIPDVRPATYPAKLDSVGRFVVKRPMELLRFVIEDPDGEGVLANARFELEVAGNIHEGLTDNEGVLEQKIAFGSSQATLRVWRPPVVPAAEKADEASPPEGQSVAAPAAPEPEVFEWILDIGHLDPIEEVTGIQGRLLALGFEVGALDGQLGPKTRTALRAFQMRQGIVEDDVLGPNTMAALEKAYGY